MTDETTTTTVDRETTTPPPDRTVRKPAAQKPRRPRGIVVNDPVADLLTRVRNSVGARHESTAMPTSRVKVEIARILKSEGFIGGYSVEDGADRSKARSDSVQAPGQLVLKLKYVGGKVPAVSGLRRISRPGLRVYARKTEMPRVLGGLGIAIVSTSSGIMTGRQAEKRGLGGEVLAYVW